MNSKKNTDFYMPEMYRKTIYVFAVIFTAVVFTLFLTACGNLLLNGEEYASVRIDLGGVTDSRGATPKAIPETVASFALSITADDMETIEQTFTDTSIELDVPAGTARTFTLTAFGPGGLMLYTGSATADLTGGGEVTIHIILKLLSGDGFILSFDLLINGQPSDGTYGIIHDELGAVLGVVPVGTSLTEIIPVIGVSEGASVALAEGGEPIFTGTGLTYTVTAENGTTKEYTINITGDKLIVLDAQYYVPGTNGGRIVQIDNLQAGGWVELNGTLLGKAATGEFVPYDIDYDIYGRIYIANNVASGGILRLDSFTDTSPEWLFPDVTVPAIAIDRVNSLIYYIVNIVDSTNELRRCDYEGQNLQAYSAFQFEHNFNSSYAGLTVDDEGMVYYTDTTSDNFIVKFDPTGSGTKLIAKPINLMDAWDILFKNDKLYVTSAYSPSNYVVCYDKNLSLTADDLPIIPDGGGDNDSRPTRFLAVLNRKFYLVDDEAVNADNQYDRILAFNDLTTGVDEAMWADQNHPGDPFKFFSAIS